MSTEEEKHARPAMNKRKLDVPVGGGDSGAENDEDGGGGAKRAKSDNDDEDDGGGVGNSGGVGINHSSVNSNVSSTSPPHQQASCSRFRIDDYVGIFI